MRKTILGSLRRRVLSGALLVAVGVLGFAAVAAADTVGSINFESAQGYNLGNINGQQGWSKTGNYDVNVVDTARFGFGRALQISNAVTTGAFGDQAFSPGLTKPAGETASKHFEASFDIATTSNTQQEGLAISVSPDNGQGARMSYLRFADESDGVGVYFTDASFNQQRIATLSRTSAHTIRLMINFKKGPSNDDVKIFIDNKKGISATTWEDYYRYDEEQAPSGNQVSPISKMLFRAGGTAAPSTIIGNGFLIDNLTLTSS
jgi:hypothetical protein